MSKIIIFTLDGEASPRAYAKGGYPLLSLIFNENFITCAKEINCFRILFAR